MQNENEKCKKCHPELVSGSRARDDSGFTLPEILIAVSIFSVVVTLASSLYIQSFREARRANMQNQIYEDARFIMARIGDEIRSGMIDYDEYYNQNVVIPYGAPPDGLGSSTPFGIKHFGQNYGRYFSSFFHSGSDAALGFRCNNDTPDVPHRNERNCTPLRRTLDRNTGANPFSGKYTSAAINEENAFCGNVTYGISPRVRPVNQGICGPPPVDVAGSNPSPARSRQQNELYLISVDGRTKTILAREKIGALGDAYALSILRLKGVDTNQDSLADRFVCADEFQCRGGHENPAFNVEPDSSAELNLTEAADTDCGAGGGATIYADLPKSRAAELEAFDENNPEEGDLCDKKSNGFSKDFVPISPFRVKITDLKFYIAPLENPHYAFAESDEQAQPRVTIVLTVANNPDYSGLQDAIAPLTLVQTVSSRVLTPIPAPLLVR